MLRAHMLATDTTSRFTQLTSRLRGTTTIHATCLLSARLPRPHKLSPSWQLLCNGRLPHLALSHSDDANTFYMCLQHPASKTDTSPRSLRRNTHCLRFTICWSPLPARHTPTSCRRAHGGPQTLISKSQLTLKQLLMPVRRLAPPSYTATPTSAS